MIWLHGYSLLLGMKSKCLAGLIDWAVSSLSFCFLCSIIWKCKWLGGSPHLLCHLLLHVGCSLCCSQPLRLTYSISSTIQTGYIFWKGADCCSVFFLIPCPCCSLAEERIQCWLLAEPCLYLSVVFWLVWAVCAWRGTVPACTLPCAVGHGFPVLKDNTEFKVYGDICCAQLL